MHKTDPKAASPLVLAYIGDCVFDLIIKLMTAGKGNRQVHKLHEETSRYVQASAQSFMMRSMQEHLTEQETRSIEEEETPGALRRPRTSPLQIIAGPPVLKRLSVISI